MTGKHLLSEIVAGLDGVPAKTWTLEEDMLLMSPEAGLVADLGYCMAEYHAIIVSLSPDRIRSIAAYVEQLEKALEPFAAFDTEDFPDEMRAFEDDPTLLMKHFRRARAALGGSNE